ncbi:MAG TPA: lipid II flippase MurJ, partial [Burkholderiaceae bacterium]
RFRPGIDAGSAAFRAVVRASVALLPGTVFVALGPLVEQAIAASLERGTVSSLGYGNRIPAAISGVLVSALGATVLPHFAVLLAQGDRAYCLHALRKLAAWLLGSGLVLGLALALASEPVIRLVFERGAFDGASTLRVAPVQQAYFLQLPVAMVAMLGARALAASGGHRQISIVTAASIVLQLALAWTLGRRFGAAGIAWAATLAMAAAALGYYRASTRLLLPAAR